MSWFRFFRRKRADAELQQEIDVYLAEEAAENIARGMPPTEAERQARIKLGNRQRIREDLWQQNTLGVVDSLWRELKYAARTLRRTPGFSIIAILVMALGIGTSVALFTVVRGVLLKPLPFTAPDRLLMLYERGEGGDIRSNLFNVVSGALYAEWRKENRSFLDLALIGYDESNLTSDGGQLPEKVQSGRCTWNLLRTLGVKPALGRDFAASDDLPAANGTVVLSWSLWKRRFAGDPAILNQTLHLNGNPYTVIGVLPAWFALSGPPNQLWTPVYHDNPGNELTELGNHSFHVVGRLRDGIDPSQAIADLSLITRRVHDEHLDNPYIGIAANARPLIDDMVGNFKTPLLVLLAAAGCVLLIACLNVANLLVARAAARRKELAIRSALGGGRLRLLRERLTESFLLSTIGGVAGVLLGAAAFKWFMRASPDITRVDSIHIDAMIVAFTLGLIAFSALFSGAVSALSVGNRQMLASLSESSRSNSAGRTRATLRRVLLALEVGLTVILLIGAGLLLTSYQRLRTADMGCATQNVLTLGIGLSGNRYQEPAQIVNFYTALLTQVRSLPGVTAAGFVRGVPGQGFLGNQGFTIAEHPPLPQGHTQVALDRWSDPGYFQAMGIPILRGSSFDPDRRLHQANQAIVSASFVRQFLPNEDPLGKHIVVGDRKYEIAGVVGDTRYQAAKPAQPVFYLPLYAGSYDFGKLVIRSERDVSQFALPVQRIVQTIDRDLPVSDVLTMDELLGNSTRGASVDATLLVVFAVLSLILAAAGLFGVLSYLVAQRTNEIGIRIALGARREQVLRLMLKDGVRPALFGLAIGFASSAATGRLIHSMLYETQPLDPAIFAAVAIILLAVAALACLIPAWRASHIDPIQALRTE